MNRYRKLTRSFGQPTTGCTTCNQGYALSDGAEIILTVGVNVDRTGQRYGGSILPDVLVASEREVLCTATSAWLQTITNYQ